MGNPQRRDIAADYKAEIERERKLIEARKQRTKKASAKKSTDAPERKDKESASEKAVPSKPEHKD